MNLEQIVKETVAKIVAEKTLTAAEEKKREEIVKAMKKDFKGPAPAMYAIATDKAKKLAEESDHEVSMAQRSLDSIIRAAMELKAKIGNQEIDIPAWIQDHITNSENYIDQASQGYHEYHNGDEHEEMNEAIVSSDNVVAHLSHTLEYVWIAGKGNNPINFQDMAQRLYSDMFGDDEMNEETNHTAYKEGEAAHAGRKHYTLNPYPKGSKEHDDFYNGWMNAETANQMAHDEYMFRKERGMGEAFQPKTSFDDYSIGNTAILNGQKVKITAMKMDDETGERRARVRFEDGSVKDVNINSLDESQDISDDELAQLQATADDTSKMPAERDAARNKIYASRAKKESQELDEWTIRKMQHYAGIK